MLASAKRIKIYYSDSEESASDHSQEDPTTNFLSLNDDCILSLFDWLQAKDFCSISKTCQRVHQLAGGYFRRKLPDIWLELSPRTVRSYFCCGRQKTLRLLPKTWREEYFSEFYQNIQIQDSIFADVSLLYRYIQTKCCKNIKRIRFDLRTPLSESHIEYIKEHLKHVESIEFYICTINDYFFDCLKICENLKHLKVTNCYGRYATSWMTEKYPHLEHFEFTPFDENADELLGTFLRLNQTIRWCSVTLERNIEEAVRCIVMNTKNLETLVLTIREKCDFSKIANDLKVLRERSNFKELELILPPNACDSDNLFAVADSLVCMKSFKMLQIDVTDDVQKVKKIAIRTDGLLQLSTFCNDATIPVKAAGDIFQKLEHLTLMGNGLVLSIENVVKPFVCFVPKLTTIDIRECNSVDFTDASVSTLNTERERLPSAREISINLVYENVPNSLLDQMKIVNISRDLVHFQTKFR